jgi:pimeloyl-ACP methyl ester carboxylesterase/catechol 2,3-dioxygenase-like lactoylglutathione lyase family enzyme
MVCIFYVKPRLIASADSISTTSRMTKSLHHIEHFRSGDVEISCRVFGVPGASPIVILHGLSGFSYDWIETASMLAIDREVGAMDLRGFGDSSFAKDYSVQAFAADVIALLDHRRWKKAVLLGHSMGGRIATYCASRHPDRVVGLVVVDWSPDIAPAGARRVAEAIGKAPEIFPSVDAAMEYFGAKANAAQRLRFEAYTRPVPNGFALKRDLYFRDQFRRALETGGRPKLGVDMWAELANVRCPVLAIRGRRSDMFAAETMPKMAAANERLAIVELDTSHNVAGEDAVSMVREIERFFRSGEKSALRPELRRAAPPLRGIDHLAFVTDDLVTTLDFYTRVLQMRLVHVRRVPYERDRGQPPYDQVRHYFFDMGHDTLLAFFEYPKGLARQNRDLPGGMQHIAFHVPRSRFDRMVDHVRSCGINVIGPLSLGGRFWSAYFYDNNGIRLELATILNDGAPRVVESVLQTEAEARQELATLFEDPRVVDSWLSRMPLKKETPSEP